MPDERPLVALEGCAGCQLADELGTDILSGKLPSVMPSETTLMETHGLARGTVRKAIDTLAEEGLVVRVQRRGTFVV